MPASSAKVMHLISSLEVGGAEKLLVEWMKTASSQGQVQYTVVIMNQAVDLRLCHELQETGWQVICLNRPQGKVHPRYLRQLLHIIDTQQIQIIHTHNSGSTAWGTLCKVLKPHLKLVTTMHNTYSIQRWNALERWLAQCWIDMNVAISKAVASELSAQGIQNQRHIYNGIPVLHFERTEEEVYSRGEPFQVLHVGRMDYHVKGQDVLLYAIRHCLDWGMNVHCRLVGGVYSYNQRAFEELRSLCCELGLETTVEFVTNQADVCSYLHQANIFVLPSRSEGLGLAALEAMAAEVPVVASNVDGLREIIVHGENGYLFEPNNPEDLARKIRLILENPELLEQLTRNARQFVMQFDIGLMAKRYASLYHQLLGSAVSTLQVKPA